jgi:Flp pilus assembly pilin Flp
VKQKFSEFLTCESGQTTTEYVLILAVIVTIFMQFRKKLLAVIAKLFISLDNGVKIAECTDTEC